MSVRGLLQLLRRLAWGVRLGGTRSCASSVWVTWIVLVAATALGGCGRKADPLTATKTFFAQVAAGQTAEAYGSATFAFRAQQSLKTFETAVQEQGLVRFATAEWEAPALEGRTARLRGEITDKTGAKAALIITLNEEGGAWRIFSIRTPRSAEGLSANVFGTVGRTGGFTEAVDRPIPEPETIKKLTYDVLLKFNEAVQAKSFRAFHDDLSKAWQSQVTAGALQRAFQSFIDNGVEISGIQDMEAVLAEPPRITTEGLLVVSGEFPTKPYRVSFTVRFIYELTSWKLFGLDVNLKK